MRWLCQHGRQCEFTEQSGERDPAVPLTWLCHPILCSRGNTKRREAERPVGSAALPAVQRHVCCRRATEERAGEEGGGLAEAELEQASVFINLGSCLQHLF